MLNPACIIFFWIGTFQGHLAPVTSVEQVETVMDALLRNRKFAGATHNIMAYRIAVPEKNTVCCISSSSFLLLMKPAGVAPSIKILRCSLLQKFEIII
jgi:hypothetical protein